MAHPASGRRRHPSHVTTEKDDRIVPLPRWLARFNRRFTNPRELAKGQRPVLTHVGRSSGTVYRVPLDAHPIEGGYLFFPVYGPRSDWVRNVLASGTASLDADGRTVELLSPQIVSRNELPDLLPEGVKPPPSLLGVNEFLRMDTRE